uniref:ADP-ribosylation factor-like protein 13B n=1 Tax=Setaria digitata TaxID=48799 RepID=A0A915Q5J1_9BILA
MGNCVGGFKKHTRKLQHRRRVRKIRICILGLDGAGKSTTIRALASDEITSLLPTNGFTLQKFQYQKAEIIAYDLGGGERIRSIWKNYYPEVFGIIYVVDGSEEDRIQESGKLLKDVISDEDLRNKPFLVILNKKDRERCIDEIQLTDRFDLHNLANQYQTQIRVEICQSNAGTGKMIDLTLKDGFEWLLERIYDDYEKLENRVNVALQKLKRRQDEQRIRRQHQLAATVSSSTTSDDNSDDADGMVVECTEKQTDVNDPAYHPVVAFAKPDTNPICSADSGNETSKRRRYLRNTINPMSNLARLPNNSVRMKNPQIFEIHTLPSNAKVSTKTCAVQTDGLFRMNGDLQSTSRPARVIQLMPLSFIPKEQPKGKVRRLRRRTDSV